MKETGADLQPYIVWVPKNRGMERDVPNATRTFTDPRVLHYWDGDSILVEGYQRVLNLPEDAWDIYLVYPPGVRWDGELPPAPAYWMHQLGSREKPRVSGPFLDPPVLREHTRTLLHAPRAAER